MPGRSHRNRTRRDQARRRRPRPDADAGPGPLLSTRALVILLTGGIAATVAAIVPDAAVPIGVAVGVVTLLAQIVRD
ncbi:hypothetical protein [Actinomadura hibisca]|uniref:hypothetical protein n=1 Tax=Actinomadura hibisca TaxID=68565 RepID=UPI000836FC7F|nr:hypothetical protein [Actinomadura hibisca]